MAFLGYTLFWRLHDFDLLRVNSLLEIFKKHHYTTNVNTTFCSSVRNNSWPDKKWKKLLDFFDKNIFSYRTTVEGFKAPAIRF